MASFDKNLSAAADDNRSTLDIDEKSAINPDAHSSYPHSGLIDDNFDIPPTELITQPLSERTIEFERTIELAEQLSSANDPVPMNLDGVLIGYDPYNSGQLPRVPRPRPPNLRRLSALLKLRPDADGAVETQD